MFKLEILEKRKIYLAAVLRIDFFRNTGPLSHSESIHMLKE